MIDIALVMTFLFREGSFEEKMRVIFKATKQHARNLAFYATIFKSLMALLRYTDADGKRKSYHSFLAGIIGGYMIFGKDNPINQQV